MKKISFFFLIFIFFFISPCYMQQNVVSIPNITSSAFAQSNSSDTSNNSATASFITCIQNQQCDKSKGSTSNNAQVQAAEDLYHAFIDYSGNNGTSILTWDPTRFEGDLPKYADPQFKNNVGLAVANHNSGAQLQCVGLVFMAVALATGNTLTPPIPGAAAMAASYPFFQAGPNYYKNMGSYIPSPGDIGVATWAPSGHILIVKKAQGTRGFIGIEANYNDEGGVRDSNLYPDNLFVFFHLQSQ